MSNSKKETTRDLETFFPEPKMVRVGGEDFEIKPFVLGVRTEVVSLLSEIITKAVLESKSDNTTAIGAAVLKTGGKKLVQLYKLILNKDEEWLNNNITMRDEIFLIKTVVEVNDIPFLLEQVKALMPEKVNIPAV